MLMFKYIYILSGNASRFTEYMSRSKSSFITDNMFFILTHVRLSIEVYNKMYKHVFPLVQINLLRFCILLIIM